MDKWGKKRKDGWVSECFHEQWDPWLGQERRWVTSRPRIRVSFLSDLRPRWFPEHTSFLLPSRVESHKCRWDPLLKLFISKYVSPPFWWNRLAPYASQGKTEKSLQTWRRRKDTWKIIVTSDSQLAPLATNTSLGDAWKGSENYVVLMLVSWYRWLYFGCFGKCLQFEKINIKESGLKKITTWSKISMDIFPYCSQCEDKIYLEQIDSGFLNKYFGHPPPTPQKK